MSDQPKLLPCPFCGGAGEYMRVPEYGEGGYIALCSECATNAHHQFDTQEKAAKMWNKRAPDPERASMARVCEAADALAPLLGAVDTPDPFRYMALRDRMKAALTDLERARKGEG